MAFPAVSEHVSKSELIHAVVFFRLPSLVRDWISNMRGCAFVPDIDRGQNHRGDGECGHNEWRPDDHRRISASREETWYD